MLGVVDQARAAVDLGVDARPEPDGGLEARGGRQVLGERCGREREQSSGDGDPAQHDAQGSAIGSQNLCRFLCCVRAQPASSHLALRSPRGPRGVSGAGSSFATCVPAFACRAAASGVSRASGGRRRRSRRPRAARSDRAPPAPASLPMPGIFDRRPPGAPSPAIMSRICSKRATSSRTSLLRRPLPRAIRRARLLSISSGRLRSSGVIERDQRLHAHELRLLHLVRELAEHRQLRDDVAQRSEPLHHLELLEQVIEAELALEQALRVALGLALVDVLLEVLDEPDDVAHPEDPRREALGPELLEPLERLARAEELDRDAGDRLHRERGAAARVAVELGQHEPVEREPLGEALRDGHRVAAHQRVADQQRVGGLGGGGDLLELAHQLVVDREAAGGVVDDRVETSHRARAAPPRRRSPRAHRRRRPRARARRSARRASGAGARRRGGRRRRRRAAGAARSSGGGARACPRRWSCRRPGARRA